MGNCKKTIKQQKKKKMIITVKNESPFQILTGAFTIGPSPTGYELQVGATPESFTTLFSVGANTPRMVTNVANGSYYRLKNNTGDVQVNWSRTCVTEGGGGSFDPTVLEPYWTSAQTKDYVDGAVSGISVDLSDYYTSAQTEEAIAEKNYVTSAQVENQIVAKNYITSADTAIFVTSAQVETQVNEVKDEFDSLKYSVAFMPDDNNSAQTKSALFAEDGEGEAKSYLWLTNTDKTNTTLNTFEYDSATKTHFVENIPAGTYYIGFERDEGAVDETPFVVALTDLMDNAIERYETNCTYTDSEEPNPVIDTINKYNYPQENTVFLYNNESLSLKWSFEDDVERIEIWWNEGNFYTNITYKPTIDEVVSAYTPTANFATINGSAITDGGNIVIQGGADMSAYYTSAQTENAITSKNYVTSAQVETQITSKGYATVSQIPTVPTSNTAFTNDAGYITSAAIADFVTSGQVENQIVAKNYITSADTANFVTSGQVETQIVAKNYASAADVNDLSGVVQEQQIVFSSGYNELHTQVLELSGRSVDLSAYYTSAQTENAITSKNYVTSAQVETQIVEKNYITSAATANMVQSTTIRNIVSISQAGYDALSTKDANTFYVITGTTA